MEFLKKTDLKTLTRKSVIYILATALCEFGIACYYTARLGTDPISVFVEGASFHCDLTVGEISTICNIILGILLFFFDREQFGFGTFLMILIAGPLIDLFYGFLLRYFPPETTALAIRVAILIAGILTYALGLGWTILCDIGVGPFSFPPLFLTKAFHIDLKYTQILTDAMFFAIGFFLGGVYGLGTIVSVLLTGPLMTFFMKYSEPMIKKIEQS
ncbi:MAG: hypothetical protein IKS51_09290 [Erysipelotrichaceae bacterium]|nr:hypothetical protein [Erysipelotrichaceae bacterium]